MPEKELGQNAEWITQIIPFALAIALSCFGGIVSYLNRIDKNGVAFSFIRLSIEILTSGFVGIISFMLCDYAKLEWSTTAAIVAISGHMGTRALFMVENATINIAESFLKRNGYEFSNSEAKTKRPKETNK
jgi:hypothetical protein